jgi:hypothetical protein
MRNDFREEIENNEEAVTDMAEFPAFLDGNRCEHPAMSMGACIEGDAIPCTKTFVCARKFESPGD